MILLNKKPVSEFRIFSMGENKSSKGTFLYSAFSADAVMTAYTEEFLKHSPAKRMQINYGHAPWNVLAAGDPESGIAAGWCDLAAREDGLYAVNVKWNTRAVNYIVDEEYKYFSPEFSADNDGNIVRMDGIAITNIPALHETQPIALSKVTETKNVKGIKMEMEEFVQKIKEMLGMPNEMDFSVLMEALLAALKSNVEEVVEPVVEDNADDMEEMAKMKDEVVALNKRLSEMEAESLRVSLIANGVDKSNEKRLSQLSILVRADRKDGESIVSAVERHAADNADLYGTVKVMASNVGRKVELAKPSVPVDRNEQIRDFNSKRANRLGSMVSKIK